jgi:hypothetical protein
MKQLLWYLVVLCGAASVAMAGPNAGGVLVVHDIGCGGTCTDTPGWQDLYPPPADCAGVDNQCDLGGSSVWRVYAVFPQASSPRLASAAWGVALDLPPVGSGVSIQAWGLANPGDLEVNDGILWPDGGGLGEAFTAGTRTETITELYWFAGYGYAGTGAGPTFCTTAWSGHPAVFVDDASIPNEDPIAGFGCLGFGHAGYTPCPAEPANGSCCAHDGSCTVTTAVACSGVWVEGGVCVPNVCAEPNGACCHAGWINGQQGWCTITLLADCGPPHVWHAEWTTCAPNPCPVIPNENRTWGRIKNSYR